MSEITSQEWLLARPEIGLGTAERIAAEHFGATGPAVELGSQQDRNFRVDRPSGGAILLKIDHSTTSEEAIDLQSSVGDRLAGGGVPTPRRIESVGGSARVSVIDDASEPTRARAFEFLDAHPLADSGPMRGVDAERLGVLAGRSVRSLAGLDHPAARRPIQWELGRAEQVVERLIGSLPADRRRLCLDAVHRASRRIDELAPELPEQIVHGDLTSDNVLVDADGELWVVDLGDAAHSWRIAELAVAAADVLGRTGSLAHVGRAVRGFSAAVGAGVSEEGTSEQGADEQTAVGLSDAELAAVWPLVVLRGAVLAVSGWSQLEVDPGNDYARERIEHEWSVFERALAYDVDEAEAQLRLAAGRPHRRGLAYEPLVDGIETAETIDFSVESRLLDRGAWLEDGIEDRLAASRTASVAVARFGEARLTRVSPDSAGDVERAAAERPRARCVELWAAPGAAIRAPFAGELSIGDRSASLRDLGVQLTVGGIEVGGTASRRVEAGDRIGTVGAEGLIRVSRQLPGVDRADAPFAPFDAEYEIDGASDPSPILGTVAAPDPELRLARERLRRNRAMGGASERYYDEPPQIERGWRTLLVETRGRAYLDMVNNVTAIGHSHPRLADAVSRQLDLLNTNSRFLYEAYADFTERLLEHSPDLSLDTVIPVNSGSEALDLAIRLAQVATRRRHVLAVREGYHGWTMAADSVSTSAFDNPHALESRPDWVLLADAPNPYRGRHRGEGATEAYLSDLRERIAEAERAGAPPAAFLCEPVHGNAGGVLPPEGYLAGAYEAIRAAGGLAIADEVQVGYGRLGSAFWGSEMLGAVPDVIATAKAAGNAFPLGAVLTRREIVDALRDEGMFFSSAGGAPASAVAGSAVLDVIRDEELQRNASEVGEHLRGRLTGLMERHPLVGAVHGRGLYLGVELVRDRRSLEPAVEETRLVCERLLGHGIIMQATSERQNVLKVKPPLVITRAEADRFVDSLDRVLDDLGKE